MLMRRMFAAAFLPLVVGAGQGSLGFGEVRYLPRGWTAPTTTWQKKMEKHSRAKSAGKMRRIRRS